MNRVAEAECATCHIIRPKPEMRAVRVRRKSGSSFGFWGSRYTGNSGYQGNRSGQSYRTSYAHQEMWVCKGCKKPRSDWTPGHYAVLGIFALVLFLIFGGRNSPDGAPREQVITENAIAEVDSNAVTIGSPAASDDSVQLENAISTEAESPDEPDSPERTDTVATFDFGDPAVIDAEAKALQTGKPIRWEAGGYSGYAIPSDAVRNASGLECRNIYATASSNGVEQKSAVQQRCNRTSTGAE